MKSSIRNMALVVFLASALLLSATSANAACADQSIIYGQTVNGSLSTTDCTDIVSGPSYYADYYLFTGTAGDKISIQLSSTSFDTWLVLKFPSGNYTNNDNGGGGTNARIPATSGYYTLLESGTYRLEATSYKSNTTGSYTLTLAKEASTTILPSAPTNVTATAGNGSATVSFTPGSIGSGTLVKYWAACGVDNTHLIIATGSSSPITVTGLTNGTVYYCWALTESTVGYSSNWSTVSNPVTPTASSATVPATGTAVEFYKADIDHYFMTADSAEATSLDNNTAWKWVRTCKTFKVWLTQFSAPSNASPVCRFIGVFANGTLGSHFYTIDQAECAYVKSRTDWGWSYEGNAFYAVKPLGGACTGGTAPVYRVFNNGMGGAPNHRYMTSQTDVDTMVSQGWVSEGVAMCAASGTSSGGTTSCGSGDAIFTLVTNQTSGQIFSAKRGDGTIFRYFGRRDADGIPESIDNIQVVSVDGKMTQIELDSANRPAKIRSPDGVTFNLTYTGNQAAVTATSPDGLTKVSTSFTFGTAPSMLSSPQAPRHSNKSLRNGIGTDRLPLAVTAASNAVGSQQSDWRISVNKCGVPFDDAFVNYVITGLSSSKVLEIGGAKDIGVGQWVASIPTNLKQPLNESKILKAAQNIEWIFSAEYGVCNIVGGVPKPELILASMCPAIAVALTPIIGPGGLTVGQACGVVSAAVIGYCRLGSPPGAPPGTDSYMKKLLEGLKDQQIPPDDISLQAEAGTFKVAGYSRDFSIPIIAKSSGPFSPTTISVTDPDGSCTPAITSISPTTGAVGTSVTITGGGFGTTQGTVTFNGTVATVTSWSDTQINTAVPTGATTGNVVVTVGAVASNGVAFTVTSNTGTGTTSATLESNWAHLNYTISGTQLDPPTGDPYHGKVGYRDYTGKLSGTTLTVSGTARSDNPSGSPGDYYILSVSVTAGAKTDTFEYRAPSGEKLNKPFSVSVPVDSTATSGNFSISLLEINASWGNYGLVVSGSLTK